MRVLIDTNVILDALTVRQPYFENSSVATIMPDEFLSIMDTVS